VLAVLELQLLRMALLVVQQFMEWFLQVVVVVVLPMPMAVRQQVQHQ
jgi:hypothetical protein